MTKPKEGARPKRKTRTPIQRLEAELAKIDAKLAKLTEDRRVAFAALETERAALEAEDKAVGEPELSPQTPPSVPPGHPMRASESYLLMLREQVAAALSEQGRSNDTYIDEAAKPARILVRFPNATRYVVDIVDGVVCLRFLRRGGHVSPHASPIESFVRPEARRE